MLVLVSSFASASVNYFYDFEDDTTGELPSYMDDLDSAGICTVSETSPISGSKSLLCLAGTTVLDYAYYNFTGLKYFENGTNFTITSDFYSGPAANSDFTFTVMSRDGARSTGMSFRQTNGFGLRLYADDVLLYGNDALSMLSQTLSMVMRQAYGHQYFEITGKDSTTQTDTSITISGDIILGMYDGQSRTSKHDNINITCWDCFPPVLSIDNTTLNMTSDGGCTAWRTNKSTACNTTDGTPTVTFSTTVASNCSLVDAGHITYCYQETANVSTDCGGLDTGAYNTTGWSANVANIYDGDWNTYDSLYSTTSSNLYSNYTIPSGIVGGKVRYKAGDMSSSDNFTIPDECLTGDTFALKILANTFHTDKCNFYCWNGTEYYYFNTPSTSNKGRLFEEAVWWDYGTAYDIDYSCSTTGGTSQVCTIYDDMKLIYGLQSIEASCSDGITSDTTGAMAINMTAGTQYSLDPCLEVLGVGCSATYTDGCYEIST